MIVYDMYGIRGALLSGPEQRFLPKKSADRIRTHNTHENTDLILSAPLYNINLRRPVR